MGTENAIFVGPWGGSGGNFFDDGSYSGVRRIEVRHADGVDSIITEYDRDGTKVLSGQHGGPGGTRSEVKLDFPTEYLTGISGYIGRVPGVNTLVIRSLTFTSNTKTYGPFGNENGTPFSLPMRGGMIVGFSGYTGSHVDQLGCYIRQS